MGKYEVRVLSKPTLGIFNASTAAEVNVFDTDAKRNNVSSSKASVFPTVRTPFVTVWVPLGVIIPTAYPGTMGCISLVKYFSKAVIKLLAFEYAPVENDSVLSSKNSVFILRGLIIRRPILPHIDEDV